MARPRPQRFDPAKIERAMRDADSAPARSGKDPIAGRDRAAGKDGTAARPAGKGRPTPKRTASTPMRTTGRIRTAAPRPATRPPSAKPRKATLGTWIAGARPPTLPLSIAPVALGTGAAALVLPVWYDHWVRALAALVVAVALQIGVNYANDYSDGIRGTDANRQGPARLVGSGRAKPRTVLVVALVFFAIAAAAGVFLTIQTKAWWLLAVGAVCIAAAWFYTGGKRPYGYAALGELAVLIFFGPVAVAGTMFVQTGRVNLEAWLGGVCTGLIAVAVLVANNLRDLDRDRASGKRTLSVLIGPVASRVLYAVALLAPFGILTVYVLLYPAAGFVWFALIAALPAAIIVIFARSAPEFVTALRLTTLTALAFGVGLGAALAFATS